MPELDENQKIQKITDLLVKGGTMLANHHDCGAPMFRYKGKIICPVCDIGGEIPGSTRMPAKDKAAVIMGAEQETQEKISPSARSVEQAEKKHPLASPAQSYMELENHVRNKVNVLARTLEDETELQRLKDKMECIETGIRILKELSSSN